MVADVTGLRRARFAWGKGIPPKGALPVAGCDVATEGGPHGDARLPPIINLGRDAIVLGLGLRASELDAPVARGIVGGLEFVALGRNVGGADRLRLAGAREDEASEPLLVLGLVGSVGRHQRCHDGEELGVGRVGDARSDQSAAGNVGGKEAERRLLNVVRTIGAALHVDVAVAEGPDFAAAGVELLRLETVDADIEFSLEGRDAYAPFGGEASGIRDISEPDRLADDLGGEAVRFVEMEVKPFGGLEHGTVSLGVAGLFDPTGQVDDCAGGRDEALGGAKNVGIGKIGETGRRVHEGAGAGAGTLPIATEADGGHQSVVEEEALGGGVDRARLGALARALAVVELVRDGDRLLDPHAVTVVEPGERISAIEILEERGAVVHVLTDIVAEEIALGDTLGADAVGRRDPRVIRGHPLSRGEARAVAAVHFGV